MKKFIIMKLPLVALAILLVDIASCSQFKCVPVNSYCKYTKRLRFLFKSFARQFHVVANKNL